MQYNALCKAIVFVLCFFDLEYDVRCFLRIEKLGSGLLHCVSGKPQPQITLAVSGFAFFDDCLILQYDP
ncbi:MAG: hypothetical protein J6331_09895, partial [Lentisphaeria bacterium]|nr:hypothetical protein [Lentisphaeria bacterium]